MRRRSSPSRSRSRSPRHSSDYTSSPERPRHSHRHRRSPPSPRHKSHRHHSPPQPSRPRDLDNTPPAIGEVLKARVVSLRPFGVFVDLGRGRHLQGLVHHSQVADDLRLWREDEDELKLKSIEYFALPDEDVWIKVIDVAKDDRGSWRVSCSMKVVDQSSGADLDPDNVIAARGGRSGGVVQRSEAAPELWSIHQGTVQSVRPFGVFVELDGFRKYALLHFSQLSDHLTFAPNESDAERVAAIQEIVAPGERVWVKIVEVSEDQTRGGFKISASLKLVNQRDGTDLDPAHTKYRPRGGREGGEGTAGGPFQSGSGARPSLAAHVGTAHGTVVDWGYLKADVVQYGGDGGKEYGILADEDVRENSRYRGSASVAETFEGQLPPRGRGRGSVMPAWMTTSGGDVAPPGSKADKPVDDTGRIRSVEDAIAVLERSAAKRKRHKKQRHDQKKGTEKKKDERKKSGRHERHQGHESIRKRSHRSPSASPSGYKKTHKKSSRSRRYSRSPRRSSDDVSKTSGSDGGSSRG